MKVSRKLAAALADLDLTPEQFARFVSFVFEHNREAKLAKPKKAKWSAARRRKFQRTMRAKKGTRQYGETLHEPERTQEEVAHDA